MVGQVSSNRNQKYFYRIISGWFWLVIEVLTVVFPDLEDMHLHFSFNHSNYLDMNYFSEQCNVNYWVTFDLNRRYQLVKDFLKISHLNWFRNLNILHDKNVYGEFIKEEIRTLPKHTKNWSALLALWKCKLNWITTTHY